MLEVAASHRVVVTVEDGFRHGGAGEFLAAALVARCRDEGRAIPSFRILGVPRAFVAQGKPDALLAELGLDAAGIAQAARRALQDEPEPELVVPLAPHQAGDPPIR
jgi:1-deoxy-D-xylulose-5-phosphate synthase